MAKKDFTNSRMDELEALGEVEGIDATQLMQQAGITDEPPAEPPADPPADPPPGDPPPGDPPADPPTDPPGTPPGTPPATPPADPPPPGPDPLNEIFGDRFKTLDEAKQADIPGKLQELESLRQEKEALEGKLATKPNILRE